MASQYDVLLQDEVAQGGDSPYEALLQDEGGVGAGNPYEILLQDEPKPKPQSLTPATDKALTDWETGAGHVEQDPFIPSSAVSGEELTRMGITRTPPWANRAVTEAGKMYKETQAVAKGAAELGYQYLPNPVLMGLPTGVTAEMLPERTRIPAISRGMRRGIGQTVEGLTSPENVAILGAMALAPHVGIPLAARQAVSAAFAAQMAMAYPELWKQFKEAPDLESKSAVLTHGVVNTVMMAMAGKHVFTEEPYRVPGMWTSGQMKPRQPYTGAIPPIQAPEFMLPAPRTTTLEEAGIVETGSGLERAPVERRTVTSGQEWQMTQDRFNALIAEADWLRRQAEIFPANPVILNRIAQINNELRILGEPTRGFTAEVEPVATQEQLQAQRERSRLAGERGAPEPIEATLGGEEGAEQPGYAQVEEGAAPQRVQARAGGAEPRAGGRDYDVGAEEGEGAGGPVSPTPGQVDRPENYVEGAPDFNQYFRSKAFQLGWTKQKRIDEYNRLYHRGSPENAALLSPDQFQRAAAEGPLRGLVEDAEGAWDNAAYDVIDDAYIKGKPINAALWRDIRDTPAPVGYTLEGELFQPDLRMKYSRDPNTGLQYSLSDEHRGSFRSVAQEDPLFARLRNFIRQRYGKEVEQVSSPDLLAHGRPLSQGGQNIIQRVEQAAKAYGARIAWFRGLDGPLHETMGSQARGTIFLNIDMAGGEPLHQVFGHELTHFIERNHPELYNRLQYEIVRATKTRPWDIPGYGKTVAESYGREQFHHELTADFMAEAMRDPVRFQQLMGQNPGLRARLRTAFNEFVQWSKQKFLGAKMDPRTASSLVNNLNRVRRNAMGIFEEARRPLEAGYERGIREARPKGEPMGEAEPGYKKYREAFDKMLEEGNPDYTTSEAEAGAFGGSKETGGRWRSLNMLGAVKMTAMMTRYHFDTFAKAGRNPGVGPDIYRGKDRITAIEQALSKGANFADIAYHYKNKFGEDGWRQFTRDAKEFVVQELAKHPEDRLLARHIVTPEQVASRARALESVRKANILAAQERQAADQKAWQEEFRHTLRGALQVRGSIKGIAPNEIIHEVLRSQERGYEGTAQKMIAGGLRASAERGMRTFGLRPEGAIEGHYAVLRHETPYGPVTMVRGPFKDAAGAQEIIDIAKAGEGVGATTFQKAGVVEVHGGDTLFRMAQTKVGSPSKPLDLSRDENFDFVDRVVPVKGSKELLTHVDSDGSRFVGKTDPNLSFEPRVISGDEFEVEAFRESKPKVMYKGTTPEGKSDEYYRPKDLMGTGIDPKTVKGEKKNIRTHIMYLYPARGSGVTNVCLYATYGKHGCAGPCLAHDGQGAMPKQVTARINKTKYWHYDPEGFIEQLSKEITRVKTKATKDGMGFAVRLNGTSDIEWENTGIFERHPDVQFYDYTKYPSDKRTIPDNYHLTYSFTGQKGSMARSVEWDKKGVNTAVVFGNGMPATFLGRPVIDGDVTDLRFLDPKGVIVGLHAKGKALPLIGQSKFIYNTPPEDVAIPYIHPVPKSQLMRKAAHAALDAVAGDDPRYPRVIRVLKKVPKNWTAADKKILRDSPVATELIQISDKAADAELGRVKDSVHPRFPNSAPRAGELKWKRGNPDLGPQGEAAPEFRESVPKREPEPGATQLGVTRYTGKYVDAAVIELSDGKRFEAPTHAQAQEKALDAGYTHAQIEQGKFGYLQQGKLVTLEDLFREARPKGGRREPVRELRPGKRARPKDLASDEPFVSRFANRYVSEDVKAGRIGEIAPGQGYSTHDLVQMGMQLPAEQVQTSIRRVAEGGLDPVVDAMAIRSEAARLSERSTRLSRIAERQPGNRKAQKAADAAFREVTTFYNGPVAQLKNAWHGIGMTMQGEHPVDLSTFNGWREEYMRTVKKPLTPQVEARLRSGAKRYGKVIDAEEAAKQRWIRQVDAIGAGKMLPSPEAVRNNIMRRMRQEPC